MPLKCDTVQKEAVHIALGIRTDGLNGMEEVIASVYPMSRIQRCLQHVQRNISSKCRVSDRAEITEGFKAVYTAAQDQLANFSRKWSRKYPKIIDSRESNINMFTLYDFPSEIKSSIYTTNMIESYNKQFKRHFKAKEQFFVSQFERYNEKFLTLSLIFFNY